MDTGSTGVTCSYPILYTAVAGTMLARLTAKVRLAEDLKYMFRGYSAETYDKLAVTLDNLGNREVVYVPLRKMWETIRHDRVDLSLVRLSIPQDVVHFIRSTLTHARIRFRTPENGVTGYVPLERGLKPDDPLSQIFVQAILDTICSMLDKEGFVPFLSTDDDKPNDGNNAAGARYDQMTAAETREKVAKMMEDNEANASGNLRFLFPNAMVLVGDKEHLQNAVTQLYVLMGVHGVDTRIADKCLHLNPNATGADASDGSTALKWGLTAEEKAQLDDGTNGGAGGLNLKAETVDIERSEESVAMLRAVMDNGVQEEPWGWDPEMARPGGWDPIIAAPPTDAGWDSGVVSPPGAPGVEPPPPPTASQGPVGEDNLAGTGTGGFEADEGLTPAQIRKREKRLAAKAKKDAEKAAAAGEGGADAAAEEALPDLG